MEQQERLQLIQLMQTTSAHSMQLATSLALEAIHSPTSKQSTAQSSLVGHFQVVLFQVDHFPVVTIQIPVQPSLADIHSLKVEVVHLIFQTVHHQYLLYQIMASLAICPTSAQSLQLGQSPSLD